MKEHTYTRVDHNMFKTKTIEISGVNKARWETVYQHGHQSELESFINVKDVLDNSSKYNESLLFEFRSTVKADERAELDPFSATAMTTTSDRTHGRGDCVHSFYIYEDIGQNLYRSELFKKPDTIFELFEDRLNQIDPNVNMLDIEAESSKIINDKKVAEISLVYEALKRAKHSERKEIIFKAKEKIYFIQTYDEDSFLKQTVCNVCLAKRIFRCLGETARSKLVFVPYSEKTAEKINFMFLSKNFNYHTQLNTSNSIIIDLDADTSKIDELFKETFKAKLEWAYNHRDKLADLLKNKATYEEINEFYDVFYGFLDSVEDARKNKDFTENIKNKTTDILNVVKSISKDIQNLLDRTLNDRLNNEVEEILKKTDVLPSLDTKVTDIDTKIGNLSDELYKYNSIENRISNLQHSFNSTLDKNLQIIVDRLDVLSSSDTKVDKIDTRTENPSQHCYSDEQDSCSVEATYNGYRKDKSREKGNRNANTKKGVFRFDILATATSILSFFMIIALMVSLFKILPSTTNEPPIIKFIPLTAANVRTQLADGIWKESLDVFDSTYSDSNTATISGVEADSIVYINFKVHSTNIPNVFASAEYRKGNEIANTKNFKSALPIELVNAETENDNSLEYTFVTVINTDDVYAVSGEEYKVRIFAEVDNSSTIMKEIKLNFAYSAVASSTLQPPTLQSNPLDGVFAVELSNSGKNIVGVSSWNINEGAEKNPAPYNVSLSNDSLSTDTELKIIISDEHRNIGNDNISILSANSIDGEYENMELELANKDENLNVFSTYIPKDRMLEGGSIKVRIEYSTNEGHAKVSELVFSIESYTGSK